MGERLMAGVVADKGQLISALAGHYKSKKEVAYVLVPAVSRKASFFTCTLYSYLTGDYVGY
jgi:hypothetical protein